MRVTGEAYLDVWKGVLGRHRGVVTTQPQLAVTCFCPIFSHLRLSSFNFSDISSQRQRRERWSLHTFYYPRKVWEGYISYLPQLFLLSSMNAGIFFISRMTYLNPKGPTRGHHEKTRWSRVNDNEVLPQQRKESATHYKISARWTRCFWYQVVTSYQLGKSEQELFLGLWSIVHGPMVRPDFPVGRMATRNWSLWREIIQVLSVKRTMEMARPCIHQGRLKSLWWVTRLLVCCIALWITIALPLPPPVLRGTMTHGPKKQTYANSDMDLCLWLSHSFQFLASVSAFCFG